MSHLLMCVSPCELVGVSWVSLDADICASAVTKTLLLSMLIPGLQCDSEDVEMHCKPRVQQPQFSQATHYLPRAC